MTAQERSALAGAALRWSPARARGSGRGIAVELGAAGATVYCTGRTTRARAVGDGPTRDDRGDSRAGRSGGRDGDRRGRSTTSIPARWPMLVGRIRAEHGALHVLVNDIWGATKMEWNATVLGIGPRLRAAPRCAWPSTPMRSRPTSRCPC